MITRIKSASMLGIESVEIDVETHVVGALRRFSIVGLPDSAVKESKERVRCAFENSDVDFPTQEVIVSLAPASLPKVGAGLDLPIALSIMGASGLIPKDALNGFIVLGELALDGSIKSVGGVLSACLLAKKKKLKIILPRESLKEASLVEGVSIYCFDKLSEFIDIFRESASVEDFRLSIDSSLFEVLNKKKKSEISFDDVIGQMQAKRALEIAAAGGHNVLMVGPPGSGKSMLASAFRSILPPVDPQEAVEILQIKEACNSYNLNKRNEILIERPFRSPHHSTSPAGILGGGSIPKPGEISLAHNGVLFLDELPEFRRDVIESLREPLESGEITISRAKYSLRFPANITLICAMNPCPCGFSSHRGEQKVSNLCKCSDNTVLKYRNRISGPILDRIDLKIWIPALSVDELNRTVRDSDDNSNTQAISKRVIFAREIQKKRYLAQGRLNSNLSSRDLRKYCNTDTETDLILEKATKRFNLSARSFNRVKKVARTIADLGGKSDINKEHVMEALQYRIN